MMANSAYTSLWDLEQMEGISETSIVEATRIWHSKCAPSPLWNDIREFVSRVGAREEWTGTTRLWDGRRLTCRFAQLPSGQTLVGFAPEARGSAVRLALRPQADSQFVEM